MLNISSDDRSMFFVYMIVPFTTILVVGVVIHLFLNGYDSSISPNAPLEDFDDPLLNDSILDLPPV